MLRSLVGSEMCIRDRVSTQSTGKARDRNGDLMQVEPTRVTQALISAACDDQSDQVRQGARQALFKLGCQHTQVVLESCTIYVREAYLDSASLDGVRVELIKVLDRIAQNRGADLDSDAAHNLAEFATALMGCPSAAESASNLMLTLGSNAALKHVLNQLLLHRKMSPQLTSVDLVVLRCLGDLALSNPTAFHEQDGFQVALQQLLPLLKAAPPHRRFEVLVEVLSSYCEASQSIGETKFEPDFLEGAQLLVQGWLQSRDDVVRRVGASALAQCIPALSIAGFEQVLPGAFPHVVRALSNRVLLLTSAECVSAMLERIAGGSAEGFMESNTNSLLLSLFPPLCAPVPATESQLTSSGARLRSELLRCFELLAKVRPVFVVKYLMSKLEDPRTQSHEFTGALGVVRHLLSHVEAELGKYKDHLVQQVLVLVNKSHQLGVSREIMQLGLAFSAKGWLDKSACSVFVPKMLEHAAQTDKSIETSLAKVKPADKVDHQATLEQFRTMCDHILDLLLKGGDSTMEEILWTTFTSGLLDNTKAGAAGIMCKCLSEIGTRRKSSGLSMLRPAEGTRPVALAVRLMLLLSTPLGRNQLGMNTLLAMRVLAPLIDPQVEELWEGAILHLVNHLASSGSAGFKQLFWEEQLMRLFSATTDLCVDQAVAWTASEQADEIVSQIRECNTSVLLPTRPVALKFLGITLRKLEPELIPANIDSMFQLAHHSDPTEQEAFAQAVGFIASNHLTQLVEKVDAVIAQPGSSAKKSGGLMSMFSGSSKPVHPPEHLQASVLQCIGWMAVYASPEEVVDYVEKQLVNTVTPLLWDLKTDVMRIAALRSVELMCKALTQKHPGKEVLAQRDEVMDHCTGLISTDVDSSQKRMLVGIQACTRLALLEPPLTIDQTSRLLDSVIPFFSLEGESVKELLSATCDMMAAVLHKNRTNECLETVLECLAAPLRSEAVVERERASMTVHFLLLKFSEYCQEVADAGGFEQFGACMGILLPRCLDESTTVRKLSVKAIETSLGVERRMAGKSKDATGTQKIVDDLISASELITSPDSEPMTPAQELLSISHMEAAVRQLCLLIRQSQALPLVQALADGMCYQPHVFCTRGAAAAFTLVVNANVELLAEDPISVLENCLAALAQVGYYPTLTTAVAGVACIASRYLAQAVPIILNRPIPHSAEVVSLLQAVAKNSGAELLGLLVVAVTTEEDFVPADTSQNDDPLPESEIDGYQVMELSTTQRSAMAALRECFSVDDLASQAATMVWFPKLLAAAVLLISSTRHSQELGLISQEEGSLTIDDAVEMTSILLQRNGSLSSLEVIESLNDELLTASVSSAVNAFSDAITMYVEPRALLSSCIDCLLPCMEKEAPEPHQLAASIFLGSALMNGYQGEASMQVASVVSALLKGTGSESEGVRWNAYSSLEGVLVVNSASVSGLIPQLVSTLGNALCGDELPHITAAAAQLLTSILHRRADYEYQLPEGMLYTFLSFAQQILERPEATLRAVSYTHLTLPTKRIV
eukprot:TRINITY_DN2222_c0_g1_i3.p1 TRINITY_DN2222_c0_g1~~TRINITY_DN2222_c0_g1_i3.p1  ORF type:complete len:1512 (-),score=405.67 TRINITY_DN2222_c0_g1_i3:175-4710(-)